MNRRTAIRYTFGAILGGILASPGHSSPVDRSGEDKPIRIYRKGIEVHPRDLRTGDVICCRSSIAPRWKVGEVPYFDAEDRVWCAVGMTPLDGQDRL